MDFETTNLYYIEGRWQCFNYSKSSEDYKHISKQSIVYLWQFSINSEVLYGRDLTELSEFLRCLVSCIENRPIIFVHNLPFEFQFMRNIISDFVVFARKNRKPIYCTSAEFNLEFRCTLQLSKSSLRELARKAGIDAKLEMDYDVVRTPFTTLTTDVLDYAERDCIILYKYILSLSSEYRDVVSIPITQTGRVRRELKAIASKDRRHMGWIKARSPRVYEEYKLLKQAFAGGQTHGNAAYVGRTVHNVDSYDIASAYPYFMTTHKFPSSSYRKTLRIKDESQLRANNGYIIEFEATGVESLYLNHYVSVSRALELKMSSPTDKSKCGVEDNGRLISCEKIRLIMTDVDYWIFRRNYSTESIKFISVYECTMAYLPKFIVMFILKLYEGKTVLKGIKGAEADYQRSKEFINSVYGMAVTNIINDIINFLDNRWEEPTKLTPELVNKMLQDEQEKKNGSFMLYSWGLYVTAYARRALWTMIFKFDEDIVYFDTDSVKVKSTAEDLSAEIELYNKSVLETLKRISTSRKIPLELFSPSDHKGVQHPMGVYEYEYRYAEFKTLGAKKYAYRIEGMYSTKIVVSGVSRSGSVELSRVRKLSGGIGRPIDYFKDGFVFGYRSSGRMIANYLDEQLPIEVIDDEGIIYRSEFKYGIVLQPTTYLLSKYPGHDEVLTVMNLLDYSPSDIWR